MPSANPKRKELSKIESTIDQNEFVKKSKVTNDENIEEVSFLFIYYVGTIMLVS